MGRRDEEDEARRHRRKAEKKPKKEKKSKHKSHKQDKKASEPSEPDYAQALVVVRQLLSEFPSIASELMTLLQMLDDGEVAVIGGIANTRIRNQLKTLFPLLGLTKLPAPKGAFSKPRRDKNRSLMETLAQMLSSGSPGETRDQQAGPVQTAEQAAGGEPSSESKQQDDEEDNNSSRTVGVKRPLPIGPALPPGVTVGHQHAESDDEEDDDVIGPALPGMKGFRPADERIEAEMERRARELEQETWDRARGLKRDATANAPMVRQEWMTVMPESSVLKDSLGAPSRPQPGKPAAFRSKEPATVDKSWFDAPEERDRAKRAKLDFELLGYIRPENMPTKPVSQPRDFKSSQPSVNESIVPTANPEVDDEIRKKMDQLKQQRGPSLLEQHQKKQAEKAKAAGDRPGSSGGWNRDRDLTLRKGMNNDEAQRIIDASKQINSKFTAPTITRQFL